MKLKIQRNLKEFKTIIDLASGLYKESKVVVGPTKLSIETILGGSSFIKTEILPDFFDEYSGEEDTFGMFVGEINKIVKKASKLITIETSESMMTVTCDKSTYKIPILSEIEGVPRIPTIEGAYNISTTFNQIAEVLDSVKTVGGVSVEFYSEDKALKVKSRNVQREASIPFIEDFNNELSSCSFSLDLLTPIIKKSDDQVTLQLKSEAPLVLKYSTEHTDTIFMVAPRAEY
jgi:hypothetical protein